MIRIVRRAKFFISNNSPALLTVIGVVCIASGQIIATRRAATIETAYQNEIEELLDLIK